MEATASEIRSTPLSPMTGVVTIASVVPLEIFELRYVLAVLALHDGNKARAARALMISRRSLYRLIARATEMGMA